MPLEPIDYTYTHEVTEATTGYFSCEPPADMTLEAALTRLAAAPLDDFLHQHCLRRLCALPAAEVRALLPRALRELAGGLECAAQPLPVSGEGVRTAGRTCAAQPSALEGQTVAVPEGKSASLAKGQPAAVPESQSAAASAVLAALLLECALLRPDCVDMAAQLPPASELAPASPLIYLRWAQLPDREVHKAWGTLFHANISEHRMLPHPEDLDDVDDVPGGQLPFTPEDLRELARQDATLAAVLPESWREDDMPAPPPVLASIHADMLREPAGPAWQRPPAQETALKALDVLLENSIAAGQEMRHQASLSPIALLRPWAVRMQVRSGALAYSLHGQATTYGRGLSLAGARASYAMEMVERASAYVSVTDEGAGAAVQEDSAANAAVPLDAGRGAEADGLETPAHDRQANTGAGAAVQGLTRAGAVLGTVQDMPLWRADYASLCAQGRAALNPNDLPLEVPYAGGPLHWVEARSATGESVLVPAQAVFLFCNLDEQALFMAGGSTGLASGNTLDEAKVAALTEIIERDAEATTPFSRARCFTLKSRDERLQALLDDYAARGIQVQFQDLTTEFGLPCFQCFVMHRKGQVARATAAKLDGAAAVLSALTETPYPYPYGEPSGPGLRGLPVRVLEDFPSFRLESPAREVTMLEKLLTTHGRQPLYVELTRKDLGLPVVRALVPRMELTAEWDAFTRIRPRIFANYFKMFE